MRSLRLREADRAPANAGARLRLRAEVRRSRVAQAGLVVSVGIGATRLRRPQSVTPPATDCGLAPALCPPLRRIGLALEPPLSCDGAPTSLWSCASATAYRHRSGAASPATAFRPRSGGHDLCPGAALRRCTPTGDHDSRPGATTLALVPRPRYGVSASLWCRAFRFWAVIPPRRRDSRRPVLAQTAATLQVSTPGFWVVLQENGLEFDALPGVLGGYFGSSLRFASMATV